eukprot:scaffold5049_cov115-Skeletonema_marinoi.AAC.3
MQDARNGKIFGHEKRIWAYRGPDLESWARIPSMRMRHSWVYILPQMSRHVPMHKSQKPHKSSSAPPSVLF